MQSYKVVFCVLFLLLVSLLHGQSHVVVTGGEASSTSGTVSYTVGQLDFMGASGNAGSISEGVQQPIEISVMTGIDLTEISLIADVFPNPASTSTFLKVSADDLRGLQYSLWNLRGQLITAQPIVSAQTQLTLRDLVDGTYFLLVLRNGILLKTFKIIRTH